MAISRKAEREILKSEYLHKIIELFKDDEDVQRVKSNEIAFPVVGCEGNEDCIVVKVVIPTGANKGTEPYDCYAMAEEYEMNLKKKAEQAEKAKIAKEKKKAKDEEVRRKKAEIANKAK